MLLLVAHALAWSGRKENTALISTPEELMEARPINDTSSVTPMTCGALVYLHIGKTGGTSVESHLEEVSPAANFSFYKVRWGDDEDSKYNYTDDERWISFKNEMSTLTKPKATIAFHHGVPGFAAYMWSTELLPMQQMLEAKGCELRLTTVLREGSKRSMSNLNYDVGGWSEAWTSGQIASKLPECVSADGESWSSLEQIALSDDCICQFAAGNSNDQVTYVQYGRLSVNSIWNAELGVANGENPLAYLANGEATTNANWAAKAIQFLEKTAYLVGCTESLDSFAAAIDAMLGVPARPMVEDNPSSWSMDFTTVMTECFDASNVADSTLHSHFCST